MRSLSVLKASGDLQKQYPLGSDRVALRLNTKGRISVEQDGPPPHDVLIFREGERTYVQSVGQCHGVYVNNVEVAAAARCLLRNGDVLKVGEVLFEFLEVSPEVTQLTDQSTINIDRDLPSDDDSVIDDSVSARNGERRLRALLGVFGKQRQGFDLERAAVEGLDALLKVFPEAQNAMLIIPDDADSMFTVVRPRPAAEADRFSVSRTMFWHVMEKKEGLLTTPRDSEDSYLEKCGVVIDDFGPSQMWQPLVDADALCFGVALLRARERYCFTNNDLRVFGVAARILAYSIAAARLGRLSIENNNEGRAPRS